MGKMRGKCHLLSVLDFLFLILLWSVLLRFMVWKHWDVQMFKGKYLVNSPLGCICGLQNKASTRGMCTVLGKKVLLWGAYAGISSGLILFLLLLDLSPLFTVAEGSLSGLATCMWIDSKLPQCKKIKWIAWMYGNRIYCMLYYFKINPVSFCVSKQVSIQ